MQTSLETTNTVPRRSVLRRIARIGFPQVVVALGAFIYFGTMIRAGHNVERQWFNLLRNLDLAFCGLLLGLWALFFSGWRKSIVATALIVFIVGGWGLFRIEYDGDLRASVHARNWVLSLFGIAHDDRVAAHRKQQSHSTVKRPIDLTPSPDDFSGYRGSDRTGVVGGQSLSHDWRTRPPRVVWRQPIYGGYSSFAVVNGFLFTMEQRGSDEAVVCYDAENGNELWVNRWPGRFDERMGGSGPRATPTVYAGDVYALGAMGRLVCLEGTTGNLKWAVETLAGNRNLTWAMSGSPLVYDDLVVVNPGAQTQQSVGRALVAYDRKTGVEVWHAGKTQAGYSSPMLTHLAGRMQIVLFDGAGLGGYDPIRGTELWRFAWRTQGADGINVAQPIVLEKKIEVPAAFAGAAGGMAMAPITLRTGQVFIASGYGRGGALVQVEFGDNGWSAEEIWSTGRGAMRCKFSSPIELKGYLFGLDDGNLQCIDLNDGHVMWTDTREPGVGEGIGHGQLLLADDLLVILSEFGEVVLVEPRSDRFAELGRIKVLEGEKTWSNPALVDGRLYIRNHREMACVDLR